MDGLRQYVADGCVRRRGLDRTAFGQALPQIAGGSLSGLRTLGAYKIHEVMDVEDVAAGKDAGDRGLEGFVHQRPAGAGVQGDAGRLAEGIFGNQADGEQKRIGGKGSLGAGDRLPVFIHPGDHDLA